MASVSLESAGDKEQEDPIRCIFFAEFHHIAGPKITCQVRPYDMKIQMIKRTICDYDLWKLCYFLGA